MTKGVCERPPGRPRAGRECANEGPAGVVLEATHQSRHLRAFVCVRVWGRGPGGEAQGGGSVYFGKNGCSKECFGVGEERIRYYMTGRRMREASTAEGEREGRERT